MAWSAHKNPTMVKEHYDSPQAVAQKVCILVNVIKCARYTRYVHFDKCQAAALASEIKKSRHFVAFTGAGVSTSAGTFDTSQLESNNNCHCRHS
jgi:hypothetical protein